MKTLLITGGAGFIGSNFIPFFLKEHPDTRIVNLDLLTYAGSLENLSEVESHPNYCFVEGDIRDRTLIEHIFKQYNISGVIHFAAESHVDNSIKNPNLFIETNINGTFTLLDVAYMYWMDGPFKYKDKYFHKPQTKHQKLLTDDNIPRFHHISTDEVYGTLSNDPNDLFTEKTPYAPNSPYSASKAASNMLVRSYHHTYGMNTVITNCSNNYGPKQDDEKLIPTIIRKALAGEPIPIYGDGKNIRDWIYVLDHCRGVNLVFHYGKPGETYNIGGQNEHTNLQIANTICKLLDKKYPVDTNKKITNDKVQSYKDLIIFVEDRPGHDRRYAIDTTKIKTQLGWNAEEGFENAIIQTIEWYKEKHE